MIFIVKFQYDLLIRGKIQRWNFIAQGKEHGLSLDVLNLLLILSLSGCIVNSEQTTQVNETLENTHRTLNCCHMFNCQRRNPSTYQT